MSAVMSAALETLVGIAEKRIAVSKTKAMAPGADRDHPNWYIREMAASPQAQASETVIKNVGGKWQVALAEAALPYEVILSRELLGHLDGYPSNREHCRDTAMVYCLDSDLEGVLAVVRQVPTDNSHGVQIIQDSWPMYTPIEGEMVELGYHLVRMYTLWRYPGKEQ
jgi:hypothetical protein